VRGDDPSAALLGQAAKLAGWTVLVRPAGSVWVIDLAAAAQAGWPRASTAKRLRRYSRNLAALGKVSWRHVRGADWNERVLEQLGQIEAESWIARETDGGDAKFLHPQQRRQWLQALADPILAEMLCATILILDDRPIAFCFDLDNGPRRYGIAGSYVESYSDYHVGTMVNYRVMADAIAAGQAFLDLGAGDSGYKREMGAANAYELHDLLFVRNPLIAKAFSRVWGTELSEQGPRARSGSAHHANRASVWSPLVRVAGAFGISAALTNTVIAVLNG
jgi:CelD/BcsL family acetyltransferase involved in cellulose biosynthesis